MQEVQQQSPIEQPEPDKNKRTLAQLRQVQQRENAARWSEVTQQQRRPYRLTKQSEIALGLRKSGLFGLGGGSTGGGAEKLQTLALMGFVGLAIVIASFMFVGYLLFYLLPLILLLFARWKKKPDAGSCLLDVAVLLVIPGLVALPGIFVIHQHLAAQISASVASFQHHNSAADPQDLFNTSVSSFSLLPSGFRDWLVNSAIAPWLALAQLPAWGMTLYYFLMYLSRQVKEIALEDIEAAAQSIFSGEFIPLGSEIVREWDAISPSWHFRPDANPRKVMLPSSILNYNTVVIAPTGSGKTTNFVEPVTANCLRSETAAWVFDPKGDGLNRQLFHAHFSLMADEREYTIRYCVLNPDLPFGVAADKCAEQIIKSVNQESGNSNASKYFITNAVQALSAILRAHHLLFGHWPNNFKQVDNYLAADNDLQTEIQRLWLIVADKSRDELSKERAKEAAEDLQANVAALKKGSGADFLGSLRQAIKPFAGVEYRDYFTFNPEYGYTAKELLEKRIVVRFALNADQGDTGRQAGRLFITQYKDAVLSPQMSKEYLKLIVIDEAHNLICDALRSGIPQSRSNNAGFVLIFQSMKQVDDDAAETVIFGSCRIKIFMPGLTDVDRKRASEYLGKAYLPILNRSTSTSHNTNSGSSFGGQRVGGGTSRSINTSQSVRYDRALLWDSDEIGGMPGYCGIYSLYNPATGDNETIFGQFLSREERSYFDQVEYPEQAELDPKKLVANAIPRKGSTTNNKPAADYNDNDNDNEDEGRKTSQLVKKLATSDSKGNNKTQVANDNAGNAKDTEAKKKQEPMQDVSAAISPTQNNQAATSQQAAITSAPSGTNKPDGENDADNSCFGQEAGLSAAGSRKQGDSSSDTTSNNADKNSSAYDWPETRRYAAAGSRTTINGGSDNNTYPQEPEVFANDRAEASWLLIKRADVPAERVPELLTLMKHHGRTPADLRHLIDEVHNKRVNAVHLGSYIAKLIAQNTYELAESKTQKEVKEIMAKQQQPPINNTETDDVEI